MSTLIIHPGPLGDVLLAVPALRALRATGPAEPLVLAAQPTLGRLLGALGVVDANLSFEGLGLEPLFVENGAEPRVPALRNRSRVICWFGAGDPVFRRRLHKAAPGAVVASPTGDGAVPVWEHLLGTVGAPSGCWREPLAVSPALLAEGRRVLEGAGWDGRTPLLMAHPGAGGPTKRWPVGGFAATLGQFLAQGRLSVAVNQGPADHEVATSLAAQLGGGIIVLKQASLTALAGALAHAAAYLGNDSGPSHLAAAVGVPSVVLFQTANLAWRPWWDGAIPLVVDTGSLRPADVVAVAERLAATLR